MKDNVVLITFEVLTPFLTVNKWQNRHSSVTAKTSLNQNQRKNNFFRNVLKKNLQHQLSTDSARLFFAAAQMSRVIEWSEKRATTRKWRYEIEYAIPRMCRKSANQQQQQQHEENDSSFSTGWHWVLQSFKNSNSPSASASSGVDF